MKIRLKLKSFNKDLLLLGMENLKLNLFNENIRILKLIFLPNKIKKFSILRSPHVNKNSFEQFEIREFKGFIDLYLYNAKGVSSLLNIKMPAGLNVELQSLPLIFVNTSLLQKAKQILTEIKK